MLCKVSKALSNLKLLFQWGGSDDKVITKQDTEIFQEIVFYNQEEDDDSSSLFRIIKKAPMNFQ